VLAFVLAACLAQSDWSGIQTRRDLSAEELSEAQDLLAGRLRSYGVDELTRLAGAIQVRRGESTPVVFIEVVTLAEHRSLERHTEPCDGPQLPAPTVQEADPWGPPLPAWDEYRDQHWVLPVEGSESSRTCPDCRGQREIACATCGADGTTDCAKCRAQGEVRCTSCDGHGRERCSSCGGDGKKRSFGKNKRCTSCGGDGKKTCSRCRSGNTICPTCRGKKQIECQACRGKKRIVCATCKGKGGLRSAAAIHIRLVAETRASTWTRLLGNHEVEPPMEGWFRVTQDGLDEAASRIADEGLRGHVLALAKQGRDGAARLRGQIVRLVDVSCRWVEYEVAGTSYEALFVEREVHEEDSPALRWVASRVADAERLLAAGNVDAADHAAREALGVEPDHAGALAVVLRAQQVEREVLARVAVQSHGEGDDSLGLHGMIGIGAFAVVVLIVVVAVSRTGERGWRRRSR